MLLLLRLLSISVVCGGAGDGGVGNVGVAGGGVDVGGSAFVACYCCTVSISAVHLVETRCISSFAVQALLQ